MKAVLFVLLSVCVLFSACKKDPIQITKDKLVGSWTEESPLINGSQSKNILTFNTDNTMMDNYLGSEVSHYSFISQDSMQLTNSMGFRRLKFSFQANDSKLVIYNYFTNFMGNVRYNAVYQRN